MVTEEEKEHITLAANLACDVLTNAAKKVKMPPAMFFSCCWALALGQIRQAGYDDLADKLNSILDAHQKEGYKFAETFGTQDQTTH